MKDRISCREARRSMQEALDRSDPLSPEESGRLTGFLPTEVRAHLELCSGCRDFLHSLQSFAPLLRSQLDEALEHYPVPEVVAVLQGKTKKDPQVSSPRRNRGAVLPAVFRWFRNRLLSPTGRTATVYRWAAVSATAVLLFSFIGFRIYSVSVTKRVIEQQVDRIVELVYGEPLLTGIESALLRTQPSISDYVEGMDQNTDIWSEEDMPLYLN